MAGRRLGGWLLGLAALALAVQGLTPALRADEAAPAARAVRLSSVDGQVQILQGGQVLAESAVANTPLFEGAQVVTGDDGRAEVQFEDGSVARLSPNSSITLKVLRGAGASGDAEIDLDGGLGYFELQGGGQNGSFRIGFGDSVATASGFSVLRINLDSPPGELAVFSGNAHLERGSALAVDLHGGESLALSASDVSRYTLNESIEPDSWDSWNSDRDQVLTAESAEKTGAAKDYSQSNSPAWNDLDANGNWYNVPGEGNIWSPYEAANPGWDPYGYGNWMNQPGFGYMWISGYPWGYLPYQCGVWNWYDSFGWGWAPGIGSCNTWWNGGGGFYRGPNIGRVFVGYRPPMRPHPPRHPFGGRGLIPVNRQFKGPAVTLPSRDRNTAVQIAGRTVQPFRPLSARPQYDHSASGFVNRTVVVNGSALPANGQGRVQGPVFGGNRPGVAPVYGARGAAGNQHVFTGGASAGHPSGGGAPSHAGSFGGGGGGSHTSGGGGGGFSGGGGGGGHAGGGGGGGGGGGHH